MAFQYPVNVNPSMIPQQAFNVFNKIPMAPPLYVGDLDINIHDETLHDFFSKFGPIHFVRIMRDPSTGKSRGFGFVNFISPRDAESARQLAQYEKLGRKHIRIMFKTNIKDVAPEANIFVKNLDPNVNVKELHNHFSQVGNVLCAKVATDTEGNSLGYGYVQFEKKEQADSAVELLQNSRLKETEVQLFSFVPKNNRAVTTARRNIYVKNLPLGKTEEQMNEIVANYFSKFGEIETKLVKKHAVDNKYSAFICYKDEASAQKAFTELNETQHTLEEAEAPLYVNWHQSRLERMRDLKRVHNQVNSDTNLYLRNLKLEVTEQQLKKAFQQFGNITSVGVKIWEVNGAQKQAKAGFIAFDNVDDTKRAQAEALTIPEIRDLYLVGAEPYINLHQSREKRNEYLYTKRRMRMQVGVMNMEPFRGMPFQFPTNRRFQPYPPMMYQQQRPFTNRPRQMNRGPWVNKSYRPKQQGQGQGPRHPGRGGYQENRKVEGAPIQPHQAHGVPVEAQQSAITVQNLRTKLSDFLQLDIEKQRQILGELLFPLIRDRAGEIIAPKITGMLIDLSVLEVSEILEFLENPLLLDERVTEAQALIAEEGL